MSYQDDNRDAPPPLPSGRQDYGDRDPNERTRLTPPEEKKGGCSKGCLWGLAGCGCVTILGVIGVVVGITLFFRSAVSDDPAVVRATTQEIAEMTVPDGLEPKGKVNMIVAKMVIYGSDDQESHLLLFEFQKQFLGDAEQQKQMERQLKQSFENQKGGAGHKDLDIVKSEQKEIKIRGETSKVTFAEAKDASTGKEFQKITGGFQGKGGPAQFILQMPKEEYKEEDIIKFLEGIK